MRMKMDDPRFLFFIACASLILFSLASTGVKVLGPCDCEDSNVMKLTVGFINKTADHLVKILLKGSSSSDFPPILLSPSEKWAAELDQGETWTYEAWKAPIKPLNSPFVFDSAGSIKKKFGSVWITIGK